MDYDGAFCVLLVIKGNVSSVWFIFTACESLGQTKYFKVLGGNKSGQKVMEQTVPKNRKDFKEESVNEKHETRIVLNYS